ncbi:MAG: hypothetical protein KUG77_21090 [Nannocystaceae bacterium]|nr:hypothetical protein [Nannocystaceae bacterium]
MRNSSFILPRAGDSPRRPELARRPLTSHVSWARLLGAASLVATLGGGCGSENSAPQEDIVYYGDVELIVQQHCLGCHDGSGTAPYALDSYDSVAALASAAAAVMEAGTMPPWAPDPDCRSLANERIVPPEDIDRFRGWVDAGTPLGSIDAAQPYVVPMLELDSTHAGRVPAGYVSSAETSDDYRCFILEELTLEEDLYMTGAEVVPGSVQVHHVLVYALDPSLRADIVATDDADPGAGYRCFGGPVPAADDVAASFATGFPTQIASWVPGQSVQETPEGMAVRILAGSPIVMQVHYSAQAGEPQEDTTELRLRLTDEPPDKLLTTRPLAVQDLDIPAGEANVEMTQRFTNYSDETIVVRQLAGHMHLLGQQIRGDVVPEAGEEACLLDIPQWDFNWQQAYPLTEFAEIHPGDAVDVTCTFDNSAENQPLVDGVPQEPVDVEWGDGTLDEMCLLYMSVVSPLTPAVIASETDCDPSASCDCDPFSGLDCTLSCEQASFGCQTCAIGAALDCTAIACGPALLQADVCLQDCFVNSLLMAGSPGRCAAVECATEYAAVVDCMDPILADGTCEGLVECGL